MKVLTLFLTCADNTEADKVANALLNKRLVACVKKMPVNSSFHWQGSVDNASEVLLLMDTVDAKFAEIEAEIKKLHSYDTFVLTAVEVVRASEGVEDWLKESLEG